MLDPGFWNGKVVTISGQYRGWEIGHGQAPLTKNDWVLQDETSYIYVSGGNSGYMYPQDLGKPITVTGTVRIKNGVPYVEIAQPAVRR